MLVVLSPIFVADTKTIFRYDFVAPLSDEENFDISFVQNKLNLKQGTCSTKANKFTEVRTCTHTYRDDQVSPSRSPTTLNLLTRHS